MEAHRIGSIFVIHKKIGHNEIAKLRLNPNNLMAGLTNNVYLGGNFPISSTNRHSFLGNEIDLLNRKWEQIISCIRWQFVLLCYKTAHFFQSRTLRCTLFGGMKKTFNEEPRMNKGQDNKLLLLLWINEWMNDIK